MSTACLAPPWSRRTPMRIVHLVNHCRFGHGNAHVAVDLACAQAARGDTVAYLSEGGDFQALLKANGVVHVDLRQRTRSPLVAADSALRLAAFAHRFQADILHAHMMSGALLGFLATRFGRARLVTTVHNSFDAHSRLMRVGDLVVAVSESERRQLIGRGFPARKVITVLNGPLFGARLPEGEGAPALALPRPSITTVCGLHARKGVADLIAAFALVARDHPEARLNIVGDGPGRAEFQAQAAATGFGGRIRFHGEVHDPLTVLRASDIFVLASHADPFPLVNLEARLAGCALIGTEVGGIPEGLDHGRAGLLVPPRDPQRLAAAMHRLLADPAERERLRTASTRGIERFGVDRMCRDYRRAYGAVLTDRHRPAEVLAAGARPNPDTPAPPPDPAPVRFNGSAADNGLSAPTAMEQTAGRNSKSLVIDRRMPEIGREFQSSATASER
jgi:glycosyltransferase involved in cell wall biosynthesis